LGRQGVRECSSIRALVLRKPWSGYELDLVVGEGGGSLRDERGDDGRLRTPHLQESHRVGAQILVAPLTQGVERGEEVITSWRKPVLEPSGMLVVQPALEDALLDEPRQTFLENVRRDAEAVSKLAELGDTQEGVADQEPCPAIADDLEGAGDRTGLLPAVVALQHE